MAAVNPLDNLLAEKGLTKDELMKKVEAEHLRKIAPHLYGEKWELLAPEIGLGDKDVSDIKEKHKDPEVRRKTFLKKWSEGKGSDATYLKLIEGLESCGNRNLTEEVLQLFTTGKENGTLCIKTEEVAVNGKGYYYLMLTVVVILSFVVSAMITKIGNTVDVGHSTRDLQTTAICPRLNQRKKETWSNLPMWNAPFVNREHDINETVRRVLEYNIVNINGAPGFGKSALANRVGFRLLEQNILVRYLDMDEEFSKEYTDRGGYRQKSIQDLLWLMSTHTDLVHSKVKGPGFIHQQDFEDVYGWSMSLNETAVLILDNCNRYLASSLRDNLLSYISALVDNSRNQLHIIIVSQEKLLLLDSFDQWTVKELDRNASVALLKLIAPHLSKDQTVKVAHNMLQGCPLAIKVVGKMLHLRRNDSHFYYHLEKDLENTPLTVIDKASEHKYRFSTVMNLTFSLFEDLRNCGYSLGLFPSSFSRDAGRHVLGIECFEIYIRHSLIDERTVANETRYTIHRLIKMYLSEKARNEMKDYTVFVERFIEYYTDFLMNYSKKDQLNDFDEFWLSYEKTNILTYWSWTKSIITPGPDSELPSSNSNYVFSEKRLSAIKLILTKGYMEMTNFIQECFAQFSHAVCQSKFCYEALSYILNQCFKLCWGEIELSNSKETIWCLYRLCDSVEHLIHLHVEYSTSTTKILNIFLRNLTGLKEDHCSSNHSKSESFSVDIGALCLAIVFILGTVTVFIKCMRA